MEWKIYIRNIVIIVLCCIGYLCIKNYHEKTTINKVIIQNKPLDHANVEFESDPLLDNYFNNFETQEHNNNNQDDAPKEEEEEIIVNEHQFYELPIKTFVTVQERQSLFDELGIKYLDHETFDYTPAESIDARLTQMYLDDPAQYEDISSLYKDDVEAQTLVPMSIQWLGDNVGYGIFAEADILEDEFIGVYTGRVEDRSLVANKDYSWFFPVQTEEGGATSLDGYWQGNELRFINDGISPNCVVQYVIGNDNLWHVCYVALTDIAKGEQLLISYGPDYWDTRSYKYQELAEEN